MNHYHFRARAVVAAAEFYERYFRFRRGRVLGHTQVLVGRHGFLLAIDEADANSPTRDGAHLGFTLRNAAAVRRLYTQMLAEGVPLPGPLASPSDRATHFYCLDPAGNRVEVGWYAL